MMSAGLSGAVPRRGWRGRGRAVRPAACVRIGRMPVVVAVPAFPAGRWSLRLPAGCWCPAGAGRGAAGPVRGAARDRGGPGGRCPEVTAAVTAIAGHQQRLGAGVDHRIECLQSGGPAGLGRCRAGRIRLHRKVVVLGGTVAMCVAIVCLVVVTGVVPPIAGLAVVLVIVVLYAVVLGAGDGGSCAAAASGRGSAGCGRRWPRRRQSSRRPSGLRGARRQDVVVAALALLVVVVASVTMERAASRARDSFRGTGDRSGRPGAGGSDEPAQRRRRRLPGGARPGAATLEHRPEQQHPQCRSWPAAPGRGDRAGQADGSGDADRRVVPRAHCRAARLRLARPRNLPGAPASWSSPPMPSSPALC